MKKNSPPGAAAFGWRSYHPVVGSYLAVALSESVRDIGLDEFREKSERLLPTETAGLGGMTSGIPSCTMFNSVPQETFFKVIVICISTSHTLRKRREGWGGRVKRGSLPQSPTVPGDVTLPNEDWRSAATEGRFS